MFQLEWTTQHLAMNYSGYDKEKFAAAFMKGLKLKLLSQK